ncbi:hypothetical protein JCM19236_460 [Vibrio sp. JCM 19236]|nr:hypothetical protein JCM19236_460 [Vibrio sp. JCM 19236]
MGTNPPPRFKERNLMRRDKRDRERRPFLSQQTVLAFG